MYAQTPQILSSPPPFALRTYPHVFTPQPLHSSYTGPHAQLPCGRLVSSFFISNRKDHLGHKMGRFRGGQGKEQEPKPPSVPESCGEQFRLQLAGKKRMLWPLGRHHKINQVPRIAPFPSSGTWLDVDLLSDRDFKDSSRRTVPEGSLPCMN